MRQRNRRRRPSKRQPRSSRLNRYSKSQLSSRTRQGRRAARARNCIVQAGYCGQIWVTKMVGNDCRAQRNGCAVADTIGERKKGQSDKPFLDCPSEKHCPQRHVKHAQSPLASKPVGSMAEHQSAGERTKAEDRDQPCRIARSHAPANGVRDHMDDRNQEYERREEPGHVEPPKARLARQLAKRATGPAP